MKLAIIGTGVIAQNQHIPCFTKNGAKITAVYDRHIEKAERIAAQLGAEAYDDYERLLREADADAVSHMHTHGYACLHGRRGGKRGQEHFP